MESHIGKNVCDEMEAEVYGFVMIANRGPST